jgi:hypothetical protein
LFSAIIEKPISNFLRILGNYCDYTYTKKLRMKFFCSTCALLVALLFATHSFAQSTAICGFGFKKIITVQGSEIVGGPHTDFPVLIYHRDADLATAAGKVQSASGFDIIFCDANGNLLDFQLEEYDGATGDYSAFVRIPSITNGTDVDIHMLYGKASIVTDQSTTTTWKTSYQGVYRLHDDFNDATSNANNATNFGSTDIADKIADGQDFEFSTSDHVQISDLAAIEGIPQVTISCWVTPESFVNYAGVVTKYTSFPTYYGINSTHATSEGYSTGLTCGVGGSCYGYTAAGALAIGTLVHLTMVFDGTLVGNANRLKFYVDGVNVPLTFFGTVPAVTASSTAILEIGRANNNNAQCWDGVIDHVSIETTAQSANWVATQYTNQNQPITLPITGLGGANDFYDISSEIDLTPTSVLAGNWDTPATWGGTTANDVPDLGAFVNIRHQIDLYAVDSDHNICDCRINNSVANAGLDMQGARVLTILQNFAATATNVATNAIISVAGTCDLNVGDDLILERVSANNRANPCRFQMSGTSTVDVTDDFLINYFNSSGTENSNEIQITGGTLNVGGDLILDHDDGRNFNMEMTAGTFNLTGDFTTDKVGGQDFVIRMSGASDFNVNGDFDLNWNGASANDSDVDIDLLNTARLDVSGRMDIDMTEVVRNSCDIRFDLQNSSQVNVGTAGGGTESCTMNIIDGDILRINLTDQSQFNVLDGDLFFGQAGDGNLHVLIANGGGAQIASMSVSDNLTLLKLDGDAALLQTQGFGSLDVDGSVSMVSTDYDGNNAHTELQLQDNSTMDIEGNLTMINSHSSNNQLQLTMSNTTQLDVGDGNDFLSFNMLDGDYPDITLNNNAVINVFGTLDYVYTNGSASQDAHFYLNNGNVEMNITGDLDLDNVKNLDAIHLRLNNGATLDVDGDIDLRGADSQDRIRLDINNNSTIEIGGDFLRDPAPNQFGILEMENNASVQYDGIAAQEVAEDAGSGTDAFTYANIIFLNTFATAPQLTLQGDVTVNQSVTFTDGIVASPTTEELIIVAGATKSGATNASFVDGYVRKEGRTPGSEYSSGPLGDNYEFPVGDGTDYQPIYTTQPGVGTNGFRARYYHTDPDPLYSDAALAPTLNHISSCEYWDLDQTAGTNSVSVRLTWDANSCGVTSETDLRVAQWSGALWDDHGYGSHSGTTAAGTILSAAAVGNFGPFTLASATIGNPLPIELISFEGKVVGNQVNLKWVTATEINNDYFLLERSANGLDFEMIAQVDGAGNSNSILEYPETDFNPYTGVSYYRLKQVDFDGSYSYSQIIPVEYNPTGDVSINVYPNPTNAGQGFNVELYGLASQQVKLRLFDVSGKLLVNKTITDNNKSSVTNMQLPYNVASGIYTIVIQSEQGVYSKKLVVR